MVAATLIAELKRGFCHYGRAVSQVWRLELGHYPVGRDIRDLVLRGKLAYPAGSGALETAVRRKAACTRSPRAPAQGMPVIRGCPAGCVLAKLVVADDGR
jgi:hypothetical protein